ncbi:arabinose-5-phosphate isomerase [Novosphingobium sp. SG751A]|uniref:KpsF/GutQ family sugar-phosphate isomerase n=1 Tax=Novosphingobium sp. SG751A TaxID=2587000 RepID=UPI001555DFC0|nr:KpsF/GutQ family sugar-phosphate isomerase [Novosphingobium sp. SG751A]NOW47897.1 arabinose-5-phosphate isomerase [Novosphingobium sp. SG751A]
MIPQPAFNPAAELTTTPAPELGLEWAMEVLRGEMTALADCLDHPPEGLSGAIHALAASRLPVLCCGVGKSGLVAAKIAATLSSLGTPAFSLSAGDASHGDLGAVTPGSVVMLFSNSGTTVELMRILPGLRERRCHLIGLIGRGDTPLARAADTLVLLPIVREADHLGMAPTASTTLQMAMGDAMAVAASQLRGFARDDFLRSHPAGALGRRAQPIRAVMREGASLPCIGPQANLAEVIAAISTGKMGAACVVEGGYLSGLIVDGDIRRAIAARRDIYAERAADVMRPDPTVLSASATTGDALDLIRDHGAGFSVLPVTDDAGRLLGMVHSVDLVQNL